MKRLRSFLRHQRKDFAFKRSLANTETIRLIIGASGTKQPGWLPSEQRQLDLLQPDRWQRYLQPQSVTSILAEHVWEHLTPAQGRIAAQTCFAFLEPGGYLRCAVPDGNHPSPQYIDHVRPGGSGVGADDHKVLYNHASFAAAFASAGFEVRLLEYFDDDGEFQHVNWDPAAGMIRRSVRFDPRNQQQSFGYTSLIIDAIKPLQVSNRQAA